MCPSPHGMLGQLLPVALLVLLVMLMVAAVLRLLLAMMHWGRGKFQRVGWQSNRGPDGLWAPPPPLAL